MEGQLSADCGKYRHKLRYSLRYTHTQGETGHNINTTYMEQGTTNQWFFSMYYVFLSVEGFPRINGMGLLVDLSWTRSGLMRPSWIEAGQESLSLWNILILARSAGDHHDHGDILPRPSNTDSAPTGSGEEPALGNYLCFYAGWPPILTTELFGGLYLYLHFVRIDLKKSPHFVARVPDGGKLLSWDSSLSLDSMGRGQGDIRWLSGWR